jgi:hypothetical protein
LIDNHHIPEDRAVTFITAPRIDQHPLLIPEPAAGKVAVKILEILIAFRARQVAFGQIDQRVIGQKIGDITGRLIAAGIRRQEQAIRFGQPGETGDTGKLRDIPILTVARL